MLNWRKFIVTGALTTTLAFSSISAMAVSFDDVSGSAGETSISKLVSLGIIVDKDTYFNPEDGLTRLEFAEIANRIVTLSPSKALKVKDVSTANGRNGAVVKAVGNGLLSLNKKGEFKPRAGVTYGDFARTLAYGLGFKKHWSNRPIDYLYYLDRKGVLDIDTDLDAVVTREEAAIAIDNYMKVKDAYKTVTGVVAGLTKTGFYVKNDTGVTNYKLAANASIFLDGQAGGKENLANGTVVELTFNNKYEVAFVTGSGLEVFDGKLSYSAGNLKFNDTVKNFNLNAVVAPLPNYSNKAFTFTEFTNYSSKAGVSFEGTLYSNTANDEITMIEAYISKITEAPMKIAGNKVTFDFSNYALKNQPFVFSEEAKFAVVEGETKKDVTLADVVALQAAGKAPNATITAGADGKVLTLTVTLKAEEKK
ncbi:MAG TPA: S-layer homology domain-containing protein [Pseudoneobacillus sp.]|nr:S-layer homology domain-containing protein [Pseudoneobacillus sp.]